MRAFKQNDCPGHVEVTVEVLDDGVNDQGLLVL